jgi:hypothetical protein
VLFAKYDAKTTGQFYLTDKPFQQFLLSEKIDKVRQAGWRFLFNRSSLTQLEQKIKGQKTDQRHEGEQQDCK